MATIENNIKKGQYLKKKGPDSYVHYHFDTDDSIVYLSDKIDGADESGAAYAKDAKLHDTLCALYTLASEGGQAATGLATLTQTVKDLEAKHTSDMSAVNTSITTTRNDLLGTTSDTAGANTIHGANKAAENAQDKADAAYNLASGQSRAWVFTNVNDLMGGTLSNKESISGYKVGDSIYLIEENVSDFWISAIASTGSLSLVGVINSAKEGEKVVVKWGSDYVSLIALESKRDLHDYITTGVLKTKLEDYYNKKAIRDNYVPYSGATKPVNLGNNTLTVSDGKMINPTQTIIDKGNITLSGSTIIPGMPGVIGQSVVLGLTEINVGGTKFKYPNDDASGTLATQEFVTDQGYQTVSGVKSVIGTAIGATTGDVTFSGSVDNGITTTLSNTNIAPGTYSALTVDAKGRATKGWQWLVFASTMDDNDTLNKLAIGGVAIIDA